MRTYTARDGRVIRCDGGREAAEKLLRESDMTWELYTMVELTNNGGVERQSVMTSLFGVGVPNTQERIDLAKQWHDRIVERYPVIDPLSVDGYLAMCKQAKAELAAMRPVIDKRKTAEELKKDNAWFEEFNAKRDAADAERKVNAEVVRARWPKAKRYITLAVVIDDSDPMTDYFGEHYSAEYVLAPDYSTRDEFGPLHDAVARIPSLKDVVWEERREKYSMGRGYYLKGLWKKDKEQRQYERTKDGSEYPAWVPEGTYSWLMVTRGYKGEQNPLHPDLPADEPTLPTPVANGGGVTVRKNDEHNGVEVVFDAKPEPSIIEGLKANGFRWSFVQKLWYAKYSEERMAWASSLASA